MLKGHIPPDTLEEIKRRADIVDLISEYVTLKKGGRNFLGLCPFHKEKTPSFTVSRDKQRFHCFGCGEGGNVLTFLMKMNDMSFPEAVRLLAGKTGVVIPERVLTSEEKKRSRTRDEIFRINKMAAKYFSENLVAHAGKGAREYLYERGILDEVIKEFCLGFALDGWRNLKEYFEKTNVPLKLVEQAGLIIPKTNGGGSFYDRFRRRLVFPIEEIGGNVIAFGGRILGDGEPKYLNTPESPVYIKGKNLYGLNRTKEDIRKKGCAILVEGYFDLIALWSAGIKNVIATLGTALTSDHVDLIRRYTGQVIVVFDPDIAGKKALARSIELFLSGNVHAKAVVLPDGHDPDQYVRTHGKDAFVEHVEHAKSLVDYYIENVIGSVDTFEEKRDSLREAVSFIISIYSAADRDLFIKRVSERLGINQELLVNEVNAALKTSTRKNEENPGKRDTEKVDMVELTIIYIMLEYPHQIHEIVKESIFDCFMSTNLQSLAEKIKDSFEEKGSEGFDASLFIQTINNEIIRKKLQKMISENPYDEGNVDRVTIDAIKQVKRKWYKEKGRILGMEIRKAEEAGNFELCKRLSEDRQKLQKEEKTLL